VNRAVAALDEVIDTLDALIDVMESGDSPQHAVVTMKRAVAVVVKKRAELMKERETNE
jgi:hypothetical protein